MRIAAQILTVLTILLVTACATVDPYSTTSHDHGDDNAGGLSLIENTKNAAARKPEWVRNNGGDFWQQVREDFRLSDYRHSAVNSRLALYLDHARQVETILSRGEPYLAYIRSEVEKRGFPGEVVLLPFIESGYDPFAYSHGRAAGLWQFIPSTGKYFGLKQDWWYDERRDIVASTNAALDYLDKLQKRFNGDWLLAFAAYNAGGGTVSNAIKRNKKTGKQTDFWNLQLPKETTGYVPKLLAVSRIINDPERYGIILPPVDSTPGFSIVSTGVQLDLVVAAELADMDTAAFYQINPGFNRWATHPEGPHRLAIPVSKAQLFSKNLAELPAADRVKWVRHKVNKGETLSHIARRYQTTVKVLQHSNRMTDTRIRAGKHLLVPVAAKDSSRYAVLDKRLQHAITPANKINYKVRNGDSLWAIAHQHQVSVEQLKKWNKIDAGALIKPGQQLVLWKGEKGKPAGKHVRTVSYTVRSGDSLYTISRKYNVSITDLKNWNKLHKKKYLQPGQRLKIHVDVTQLTQT